MMNNKKNEHEIKNLTQGRLWKQILLFSLPLILSNILQVLFNISDIAVVGKFAGKTALGAVGSTTILLTVFTEFLIGLAGGINVLTALAVGSGNETDIKETVHTSKLISIITGVFIMILGIVMAQTMLNLINTKPELLYGAVTYLRIYLIGIPGLAVYNWGNAVLNATGETKKPLIFLLVSGILNVVMNLLFVITFKMGVRGAAFASVISQYLSAFLIFREIIHNDTIYKRKAKCHSISTNKALRILKLGIPAGLQYAIFGIANLFVQKGVNSFSATTVAGNTAAANFDAIIYGVMSAFYTACGSFMGQNIGAGKKERIKKSYLISMLYPFGAALLLGLILVFFGKNILSLFSDDAAVINAGVERFKIMGFSYCISAFMDCTISASRAYGKTIFPTIIVILGSCVFRIVWIYTIFAYFGTITSLYLLYVFSWIITATAEIIYYSKCDKSI